MVTGRGGVGIPVQADHADEAQVRTLFARVKNEQGQLHILVNDVWGGDELVEFGKPFWELALDKGLLMLQRAVHTHIIWMLENRISQSSQEFFRRDLTFPRDLVNLFHLVMTNISDNNLSPPIADVVTLQKTISELQTLNRLAQKIIAASEVETALDEVVAETARWLNADGCSLLLVQAGHANLEATHAGKFLTLARRTREKTDEKWRQLSRNIAGWIIKNQSALISENLANDERFPGLALFGDIQCSAVGMPVMVEEKIVGALMVFKTAALSDSAEVAHFMQQIAEHVAPALIKLQRLQELAEENRYFRQSLIAQHGFAEMIAKSAAMQNIFAVLQRVMPSDARVLIEGESGTGKELVARALHFNGPRQEKKFLAVDCGAIPENLLESELFGHVKGAFTGATQNRKGLFQEVNGGTLFLDEINNLPMPLQAKLMRVLQEGEVRPVGSNTTQKVDVRLIAASSDTLAELVKQKRFREDLYFRLKVVTLKLPPLRERTGDIPLLANHFLKKYAKLYKKTVTAFEPAAMRQLQQYVWPGNIRELEHAIEQAVVLTHPEATVLAAADLPVELSSAVGDQLKTIEQITNLPAAVEALEIRMIKKALAETHDNKSRAAEKLGLSRRGLLNKLDRYKIANGEEY